MIRTMTGLLWVMFLGVGGVPAYASEWATPSSPPPVLSEPPVIPQGWRTIEGPYVAVHGELRDDMTLRRLEAHASKRVRPLADQLGVEIGETIHVYLTPDQASFKSMQPGAAPSWADATAYPSAGVIYLRAMRARIGGDEPLEQVLDHELVHILVGRAFVPNVPPSWLQEGLAQVLAHQHGPGTLDTLAKGQALGGLIPLSSLVAGFPRDAVRAELAYAQSADLVAWMRAEYGEDVLPTLLHKVASGSTEEAAFYAATGHYSKALDKQWRARFDQGVPLSFSWLVKEEVWFALAGVLLLFGGWWRRRTFLKRLKEMEEEEKWIDEVIASYGVHMGSDGLLDWKEPEE